MTAGLIKSSDGTWKLNGLRHLSFDELASTLDQVLSDPDCPAQVVLTDLGETYASVDLIDTHARSLLWQEIQRRKSGTVTVDTLRKPRCF